METTRRWAADGITANALMPGAIHAGLRRHTGGSGSGQVPAEPITAPEQGAANSVLLATSPLLEGVGGRYFDDCDESRTADPDSARLLRDLSEELRAG